MEMMTMTGAELFRARSHRTADLPLVSPVAFGSQGTGLSSAGRVADVRTARPLALIAGDTPVLSIDNCIAFSGKAVIGAPVYVVPDVAFHPDGRPPV